MVRAFTDGARYRSFGPGATETAQISGCMSLPLTVNRKDTIGSLNLYAERIDAYAGTVDTIATRLAQQATLIVTAAMAHERTTRLVAQLRAALISRAAIEQAKGILTASSRITADEAFDVLRRASQRQNVKRRDVAHQIVDNLNRASPTGLSGRR